MTSPAETEPNDSQEASAPAPGDAQPLTTPTLSENGVEESEEVTVVDNGGDTTNHSVEGAGAARAALPPTLPKAGSYSWTIRCPDNLKSGLVDTDTRTFTTDLDNQKNRSYKDLPEYGRNEYTARVIGLSSQLRDELEIRLTLIFTEVGTHEGTFSKEELLKSVKEKLLDYGWPLKTLEAGRKRIEETLGSNHELETLVKTISDRIVDKLDGLLLDPVQKIADTSAEILASSLRDDSHQLALQSILEAMDIPYMQKRIEGADVHMLMYKLSELEQTVRTMESDHKCLVESNITLAGSLSKTKKTALTHSFHLMELVLRLDCVSDKAKWKALDNKTRLNTVIDVLNSIVGNNAGSESDIWCMRDTQRAPGGVKVTFLDTATKFLAEKKLSAFRADKQKSKQAPFIFTSSRMAPVEFSGERKTMEQHAREKITYDWIQLVKDFEQQGGDKDLWASDPDTVSKCLRLRVKWKLRPTLTVWTEAQDPVHRYVWRPFKTEEDFFKGYKLSEEVPCPHTKDCLSTNPEWSKPRQAPPHLELRRRPRVMHRGDRGNPDANLDTAQVGAGAGHVAAHVGTGDTPVSVVLHAPDTPPEAPDLPNIGPPKPIPGAGGAGSLVPAEVAVNLDGKDQSSKGAKNKPDPAKGTGPDLRSRTNPPAKPGNSKKTK